MLALDCTLFLYAAVLRSPVLAWCTQVFTGVAVFYVSILVGASFIKKEVFK
jgi:hypothetical protein